VAGLSAVKEMGQYDEENNSSRSAQEDDSYYDEEDDDEDEDDYYDEEDDFPQGNFDVEQGTFKTSAELPRPKMPQIVIDGASPNESRRFPSQSIPAFGSIGSVRSEE